MTEEFEPECKKPKMADNMTIENLIHVIQNSEKNLEVIINDDLFKPIPLIKVYIGHVKDPKDISKMFKVLNEKIPLKELHHLKRVRKRDVLLCPTDFLNIVTQESIQEYIERNASELKDCFEYFKDVNVPLNPPLLRKQYLECSKHWSVNFHPNKYLERLLSDSFFGKDELHDHRLYMSMTLEVAKWYLGLDSNIDLQKIITSNMNIAIVVDPDHRSVVAVAFDNRTEHPLQHAAMLAIDNVAKTQNGGAWSTNSENSTLSGIKMDLLMHLKSVYRDVNFGAKKFVSKRDITNGESCEGPYLCTGYYVYLLREPCIMCSMGLVHARAKRIFFSLDNNHNGGLKSRTKLQCVDSLNHHFEVFSGFL